MKKLISLALVVLLAVSLLSISVFAETEEANVFVTISDGEGKLVMTYAPVELRDLDGDGALTINDTLIAAHESVGKADAYVSSESAWGLSITKLWGDESGNYGYFVNDSSAMSLTDAVKAGDHIKAFIYTDSVTWSDIYCFFDRHDVSAEKGDEMILTLCGYAYDENWNRIVVPVSGAKILIDGEETGVMTDANGKAIVTIEKSGDLVISADSDGQILVPPVCLVHAEGGSALLVISIVAVVILVACMAVVLVKKFKNDAK